MLDVVQARQTGEKLEQIPQFMLEERIGAKLPLENAERNIDERRDEIRGNTEQIDEKITKIDEQKNEFKIEQNEPVSERVGEKKE